MTPSAPAARFEALFGHRPTVVTRARGRVNLIGEHVDYQGGWVLPTVIDRSLCALAAPAASPSQNPGPSTSPSTSPKRHPRPFSRLHSTLDGKTVRVRLADDVTVGGDGSFAGRVAALAASLMELLECPVGEIDLLVDSDLPSGGGLSSSAALSVAVARCLLDLAGRDAETLPLVECCRRAERLAAGVACGLMDPLTILETHAGEALLIDCAQRRWEAVPLPASLGLLVIDTGVHHNLATAPYAERQRECVTAAQKLGVRNLREATELGIDSSTLPSPLDARAGHVISEMLRVLAAVDALRSGDLPTFGEHLRRSHASLRDRFEVSSPELDEAVEAATRIGDAVYGARMTGAGFGGCVIVACDAPRAEEVADALRRRLPPRCAVYGVGGPT